MAMDSVIGVILAGGRSSRMGGGDKPLRLLGGRPLLTHVIDRLRPQVHSLVLNANGDPARFAAFALAVVADPIDGYEGPLAGILAGLTFAANQPAPPRAIVTAAADTPFLPNDLVARLASVGGTGVAIARTGGRLHPVFGYFPITCAHGLDRFLKRETSRKVSDWLERTGFAAVDFPGGGGSPDPFFNINTPVDLDRANALIAQRR